MPSPVVIPVWGKPVKTFERLTASLADLAKGGNLALALYRDTEMGRGLLLSLGKRIFEGPFDQAAAHYNKLVRSWWARSFPGMQVPVEHLYVAKASFKAADKVYHKKYGTGTVDNTSAGPSGNMIGVLFDNPVQRMAGVMPVAASSLSPARTVGGDSTKPQGHIVGRKAAGAPMRKAETVCPKCGNDTLRCPECGREYAHGEASHCENPECQEMNAPLDCAGCGLVAADGLQGVIDLEGDLIRYKAAGAPMRKAGDPKFTSVADLKARPWGRGTAKGGWDSERASVVVNDKTFACEMWDTGSGWMASVLMVGNTSPKQFEVGTRNEAIEACAGYIQRMTKTAGAPMRKAARPVMRKGLIEDGDGAPNLDSVSIDQLRAFVAEIGNGVRPIEAAKRMFPDQGKGAVEATKNLRNYAWNKITAMQARLDGNIPEAQKYEAVCDRIYDALPSWARW